MAKARQLWPLALILWLCFGLVTWAQVQVSGSSGFNGGAIANAATFPDGTVGAPSIAWTSDADGTGTGFYRPGANQIGAVSNGISTVGIANATLGLLLSTALKWSNSNSDPLATTSLSLGSSASQGSLRIFTGTTPTQSGTTCGTGPTLAGDNTLGSVILGTAPGLPCTIVFNGTWTAAPYCFLNPEILTTGTTTVRATSITTTGFVITSTAALVAADKVSWFCVSS